MNVLIGCEFSGIVRDAFIREGHRAISVDLLPSERPGPHWQGDLLEFIEKYGNHFHLLIAHPPCQYLCNSGVRWLHTESGRERKMRQAARFFKKLLLSKIQRKAIENPVMHGYAAAIIGRRQDQIIQPWQFGHGEIKATGWWLEGLSLLEPTRIVKGRTPRVHRASPGEDRWKERSRTLPGIARAMARQWGKS